jgi:hypothetical protein
VRDTFNIYCDESCHLPNDHQSVMVIGALTMPKGVVREVAEDLRQLKADFQLGRVELKWTKVSPSRFRYFVEVVDYFFDRTDVQFRAVVAPKGQLDPGAFGLTFDDLYWRLYYYALRNIVGAQHQAEFNVYVDIKEHYSGRKVEQLADVLRGATGDGNRIGRIQIVRSHEVEQVQLADLLIGAVAYANRPDKQSSRAKLDLVHHIAQRAGSDLLSSSLVRESKFDVFHWRPRTPD